MGCGCGRKNVNHTNANVRSSSRRTNTVTPAANQQFRVTQNVNPSLNSGGLTSERRKTQAIRREAIRKALGK